MPEHDDFPTRRDTFQGRAFPATRWTLVLEARKPDEPRARRALEELCRAYWFPIYAFLRRQGWARHDAEDLTQGFFAGVLSGDTLAKADPDRGRLRTLLLAELKKHLADVTRAQQALKRGGGALEVIPLDEAEAEGRFAAQSVNGDSPELLFDRGWARDLLDRVRARLRENYAERAKAALFDALAEYLAWNEHDTPYRELAARLDFSEPALRLQVFRLRQKYRELLEAEVADTVASPEELEQELAYLKAVLRE